MAGLPLQILLNLQGYPFALVVSVENSSGILRLICASIISDFRKKCVYDIPFAYNWCPPGKRNLLLNPSCHTVGCLFCYLICTFGHQNTWEVWTVFVFSLSSIAGRFECIDLRLHQTISRRQEIKHNLHQANTLWCDRREIRLLFLRVAVSLFMRPPSKSRQIFRTENSVFWHAG